LSRGLLYSQEKDQTEFNIYVYSIHKRLFREGFYHINIKQRRLGTTPNMQQATHANWHKLTNRATVKLKLT